MKILEINHLNISYGTFEVIHDVSFHVNEGQWLMIVGPNGAGKSTILHAISRGVDYEGNIIYRGNDIRRLKPAELARHIGVLAQNHSVGYDFSVSEVVNLGRYAYGKGLMKGHGEQDTKAVEEALQYAGLADLAHKSILHLSGGEVQRTFLAQLFAQNPDVMILDEPANHLDLLYQKQVFELIQNWLRTPGRAVISVVHDLSLAKAYGTDCLLLDGGRSKAFGKIEDVLVPELLNDVYGMDVRAWMNRMLEQWNDDSVFSENRSE